MRVLILIDLFPPIVGGAETHAGELARALTKRGVDVQVLTRRSRPDLPAEETLSDGVRVSRLDAPGGKRLGKYGVIPAFKKALRTRADSYDLIYLCGFRALGLPIANCARRLGKALILRAEVCGELSGAFILDQPGRGRSALLHRVFSPLVAARNRRMIPGHHFLAISSVVADEYRKHGVADQAILRISNGIDLTRFSPVDADQKSSLRKRLGVHSAAPVFCYTGKLNRGKGLDTLLPAWKRWVDEKLPGSLLLVGAGGGQYLSWENECRAFVDQHNLHDRVQFAGYQQNVEEWLQASDLFVFPSEMESFGLSPLEAAACGLPVISSNAGALSETVPDGCAGRALAPGNPEVWFDAMRELYENQETRQALSRSGLDWVRSSYSFDAIAQQHIKAFTNLVPGESA